jgi:hypothetical protein
MIPGAAGTSGSPTAGVVIVGCCTTNNECGVDYGIGGCQARSAACQIVSKANIDMIKPMTCDGKAIDLPADCGSNLSFPGAGGAGGSLALLALTEQRRPRGKPRGRFVFGARAFARTADQFNARTLTLTSRRPSA